MSKWTNISGILIVDAGYDEGEWYLEDQKELPDDVIKELDKLFLHPKEGEEFKIKIHFLSSGTYTPENTNCSVENSYPSDFDDKREIEDVEVKGKFLSQTVAESFAALFEKEINAVEIDFQGEC
jgi:hypothetical protein